MVYLPKALLQALQVQLSIGTGPQLCPESFNTIMVWVLVLILRLTKPLLHLGSWPGCHGCGMSRRLSKATSRRQLRCPRWVQAGASSCLSFGCYLKLIVEIWKLAVWQAMANWERLRALTATDVVAREQQESRPRILGRIACDMGRGLPLRNNF